MSLAEKIYFKSPVWLQNVAIGIIGIKIYFERYNKYSNAKCLELAKSKDNSLEQIKQRQDDLFNKLVNTAIGSTRFYQEKYTLSKNYKLEDIVNFTPITKEILRENTADFVTLKLPRKKIKLTTSGTTGTPLQVTTTAKYRAEHYAFFTQLRHKHGISGRSKRITIFGRVLCNPNDKKGPFWRYDVIQNNLLMSSYHLSNDNLAAYVKKINEFAPKEIFSYPSSLFEIAKFALQNNLSLPKVDLIMSTAESLQEQQRKVIEKAFNSTVVNQYGCTEMAFFANECEYGVMHVHPEHGFLEVQKEDKSISKTGFGSLLATGFVNLAMPIIRYEVGDLVELEEVEHCNCGQSGQVIKRLEGRMNSAIKKPDGTPITRLASIFKGDWNILAAAINQKVDGEVELLVVPSETNLATQEIAALIAEARTRVGNELTITVKEINELPKLSNGKVRSIHSDYKPPVN